MTSKRGLEMNLEKVKAWRDHAVEQRDDALSERDQYRDALERVAKLYGFHGRYLSEHYVFRRDTEFGTEVVSGVGFRFDPEALIADLDTIDQARSADEARARLGIGGNECEREQAERSEPS